MANRIKEEAVATGDGEQALGGTGEQASIAAVLERLFDAGIVYRDHVRREQRQPGGSIRNVWTSTERAVEQADVLATRVDADGLIAVLGDGQKLRIGADGIVNMLEV